MTDQSGLRVKDLHKNYGAVTAVNGVSFNAPRGAVTGLIGPNGAGKTSVFDLLSGITRPTSGAIFLDDCELKRKSPQHTSRAGIQRTFQLIRLFGGLTVLDNVAVGLARKRGTSLASARRRAHVALEAVAFVGDPHARPADLPYAYQRKVELARALALEPSVLLLDEPAAGMHQDERTELVDLVRAVAASNAAVLLVEHDMGLVSRACDSITVMDFGTVIARGSPEEIKDDPLVIEAYIGRGA